MNAHPKPSIDTVRTIIQQIAKGLRAFHRMEMLHQDLKPENIMFDASGVVKIIDFGSVKIAGIAEIVPNIGDDTILGTLNYSAPEYHLGQRGSVRSDLFSLAVIMYEMFNNTLPFGPAMTTRADAMKLAKLRYTPSIHHNPMVPIWIDGALQKATAINPQLRYNDLSEFLYDLTTPNHAFFSSKEAIPLLERNPLRFWQGVSLLLLVVNIVLVYQLVKSG
ncbi:serine/threonine protein kinase [Methylocucumis oryzae]|uniref:serine/threonine protein kinase n=1 Tax=Methylocucumis oryzae TaxID=1632867 RepID=UPI000B219804